MSYLSILPDHLSGFETWIARIFILLGLLTIAPWAILLCYDVLLYLCRTSWYFTPIIGGRARGQTRPDVPTLETRPGGHARSFSVLSARFGGSQAGAESPVDSPVVSPAGSPRKHMQSRGRRGSRRAADGAGGVEDGSQSRSRARAIRRAGFDGDPGWMGAGGYAAAASGLDVRS